MMAMKDKKYDDPLSTDGEKQLLLPRGDEDESRRSTIDDTTQNLFRELLERSHVENHKTHPHLPPERRGKRHRNWSIFNLNRFRHWWKTSRLLVRLAGAYVIVLVVENWKLMASLNVAKHKQARKALKLVKKIGRGGSVKPFLSQVRPFTRTLRLILAIARALEARVDHRFVEVGLAEAFAFMGNRCSRYWARHFSDWFTANVMLPFSLFLLGKPLFDQMAGSRPFMIVMGFVRAVLPFASSFQGSRFGRQVTYSTFSSANFRWRAVQKISRFYEEAGTYKDTDLDQDMLRLVRKAAEAIGHGADPVATRLGLAQTGFQCIGCGAGGYAVYKNNTEYGVQYLLHLTPYGPAILDEMPRFVYLERRPFPGNGSDTEPEVVQGFTYSGSFFQSQEWAALRARFQKELDSYTEACRIMGTCRLPWSQSPQKGKYSAPPLDLANLKAFLRTGRKPEKQRRDNKRFRKVNRAVNDLSKLLDGYKSKGRAPKEVILYFEGLDCAGKSSTGMLISHALEQSGYSISVAQHNRPPNKEQRSKPWMDRGRFEHPEDMFIADGEGEKPDFASVIWDRGPGGDFVYGDLNKLPTDGKLARYSEFQKYDQDCGANGILFLKLFFVADRDSIAATLGKRLAHKKIAGELKTWLDANSVPHFRQGLDEIEHHIDPSDFTAFNKYESNISHFTEFVRNTDSAQNPWLVVNTSNRDAARNGVLNQFRSRLNQFAAGKGRKGEVQAQRNGLIEESKRGVPIRALVQAFVLVSLAYAYAHQTWNVDILQVIDDL